ncbi:hypothetical protein BJY59DRAFT_699666 [Rhodotorula toruloides]
MMTGGRSCGSSRRQGARSSLRLDEYSRFGSVRCSVCVTLVCAVCAGSQVERRRIGGDSAEQESRPDCARLARRLNYRHHQPRVAALVVTGCSVSLGEAEGNGLRGGFARWRRLDRLCFARSVRLATARHCPALTQVAVFGAHKPGPGTGAVLQRQPRPELRRFASLLRLSPCFLARVSLSHSYHAHTLVEAQRERARTGCGGSRQRQRLRRLDFRSSRLFALSLADAYPAASPSQGKGQGARRRVRRVRQVRRASAGSGAPLSASLVASHAHLAGEHHEERR